MATNRSFVISAEEIKALERHWFEEASKEKAAAMAVIDELRTTNYVIHRGTGEDMRGLKDYGQYMMGYYSVFSDLHLTIDDMVVEGARRRSAG